MGTSRKAAGWELERVYPICQAVARRALPSFRGLPSFDLEDLTQQALLVSLTERYQPETGVPYRTWLWQRLRHRLQDLYRSASADRARADARSPHVAGTDLELLAAQHGLSSRSVVVENVSLVNVFESKMGAAIVGELKAGDKKAQAIIWVGRLRQAYLTKKAIGDEVRSALREGALQLARQFPDGTADPDAMVDQVLAEMLAKLEELGTVKYVTRAARGAKS